MAKKGKNGPRDYTIEKKLQKFHLRSNLEVEIKNEYIGHDIPMIIHIT